MSKINIVNVSGGVDSTACYLLAIEERERTGEDFRAVFADTGNEHDMTIAYVNELAAKNKTVGLTEEELEERAKLRRMYIDNVTGNLKGQLDNTYSVRPDGTKEKVIRK